MIGAGIVCSCSLSRTPSWAVERRWRRSKKEIEKRCSRPHERNSGKAVIEPHRLEPRPCVLDRLSRNAHFITGLME